ncbi:hypothetical protein [Caldifermentibacillus hisashii]|uniref:hypothetical protein n=1 Tax=Caldifermentibacillus hisashii TaxID=996558 RepID=UPI0031B726D0
MAKIRWQRVEDPPAPLTPDEKIKMLEKMLEQENIEIKLALAELAEAVLGGD